MEANAYRWYDFYKSLIEETTHGISIVTTKKGNLSLRATCDDGSIKTLHSLYDPEAEAMTIVDAFQFDGRGILVVLGLGLGYHLKELIKRFPEAEILVVEAIPEIYEMAMQHGMISGLEGRIEFVVGFAVDEAINRITSQQMKLGMVSLSVFSLSSAVSAFQDYYSPILTALRNTMNVKLWDRLRYPKFREDVCSVALIDFGYFLTREIESALRSLGHRVIKVPVSREEGGEVIVSGLIKKVCEFNPDFIFTINHLGLDEDGVLTSFLESIEMPLASWYVDSPNLIVRAFDRNISPYVSLFLWDRGYIKDLEDVGFESVTYLPLATDDTVFMPGKNRRRSAHYQCDVSFVGNSMVVPALESLEKIPSGLYHLVEKMALLLSSTRMPFDAVLATLEKEELSLLDSLSAQKRLDLEAATLWRATLFYRLSCVETLKAFHPRIHGDVAWKKLLGEGYTFGPPLNYYNELAAFYNICKINFNATSLQMLGAVNQRVFDVPACGAFLLTDHQEAIEELFDVGKEVIIYKNRAEIPDRRIRLGYLSHHFGNQPISHVTRGLYALHNRDRFEVIVYSLMDRSTDPGPYLKDIKAGCDRFVNLAGVDPAQAAQRIHADEIDILIDLSGYMPGTQLPILSQRPAPVQVYWLGHGGGLGLTFIDYVIADETVIPHGEEAQYTEKVVRLPDIYHSTDTPPISDECPPRSHFGLADDAFVFCAFNNQIKINREVFDAWMRILQRVPGSQIWLSNLQQLDRLSENYRAEARMLGVDPDRLVFAGGVLDKSIHFARHRLADLFLDTFSYNASTTAIDALWAGLPVLTRKGDYFQSRIAASMLKNIGLEDMICHSAQEYEDRAVGLAQDPERLAGIRGRLWVNRVTAPLFDTRRFLGHLEAAYATMWKKHQQGSSPESFDVPLQAETSDK